MNNVHLAQIDLNLLRIFDALSEENSATRAGERLGLSQSAISHALGRLRQVFDDPLFVRGANGMRPTVRAAEIAPALREALVQLQLAISPSSFFPQQTDRRFNIAAGAYVAAVLLPCLVERIRSEAPQAEIRVRAIQGDVENQLRAGGLDLAIGAFPDLSERVSRQGLFEEKGVWALRADHPQAQGRLTLETLAKLPHVMLSAAQDNDETTDMPWRTTLSPSPFHWTAHVDVALGKKGLKRNVAVRMQDVYGALAIVSRTDMTMLAPRRMAQTHAEALGLKLFDPPYPSPNLIMEGVWSTEAGGHPAVEWLRSVVKACAASI
jgi:DNA-binding transcriptional LysR family regulator